MTIYSSLQKLAKSVKYQNLFFASKEINGVRLFKNTFDFSSLQRLFLNYLWNFELIYIALSIDKISEKVLEDEIFWDAYLLWNRKENNKKSAINDKQHDVKLVSGKKINFPNKQRQ